FFSDRQGNRYGGSFELFGLDRYASTKPFNGFFHDVESKPGAVTFFGSPIKHVIDKRHYLLAHADTIILDNNLNVLIVNAPTRDLHHHYLLGLISILQTVRKQIVQDQGEAEAVTHERFFHQ